MNGEKSVQVLWEAESNARLQFGLNTKPDLLSFIGNGGLRNITYISTEPWRNNPRRDILEISIDSYNFSSNKKVGYIAFFKGQTGKYVIKSFHENFSKLTLKDVGIIR
jgi:hypothetical protein